MRLYFVTTNPGKLPSITKNLARYGIEVRQLDYDVPEIQSHSVEEVARYKVEAAVRRAEREFGAPFLWPVMVIDSAFHIDSLNGFPGPLAKLVTQDLDLEGYLRLMLPFRGPAVRGCTFVDALACQINDLHDSKDEPKIFTRRIRGRLALQSRGHNLKGSKSKLWRLFIPEGFDKTLAEMSEEELDQHRSQVSDIYDEFGQWFVARMKEIERRHK